MDLTAVKIKIFYALPLAFLAFVRVLLPHLGEGILCLPVSMVNIVPDLAEVYLVLYLAPVFFIFLKSVLESLLGVQQPFKALGVSGLVHELVLDLSRKDYLCAQRLELLLSLVPVGLCILFVQGILNQLKVLVYPRGVHCLGKVLQPLLKDPRISLKAPGVNARQVGVDKLLVDCLPVKLLLLKALHSLDDGGEPRLNLLLQDLVKHLFIGAHDRPVDLRELDYDLGYLTVSAIFEVL